MSFPTLEAEPPADHAPAPSPDDTQERNGLPAGLPAARPTDTRMCAACDGSGLWRGIDGFVFVCQHCTFEMT